MAGEMYFRNIRQHQKSPRTAPGIPRLRAPSPARINEDEITLHTIYIFEKNTGSIYPIDHLQKGRARTNRTLPGMSDKHSDGLLRLTWMSYLSIDGIFCSSSQTVRWPWGDGPPRLMPYLRKLLTAIVTLPPLKASRKSL